MIYLVNLGYEPSILCRIKVKKPGEEQQSKQIQPMGSLLKEEYQSFRNSLGLRTFLENPISTNLDRPRDSRELGDARELPRTNTHYISITGAANMLRSHDCPHALSIHNSAPPSPQVVSPLEHLLTNLYQFTHIRHIEYIHQAELLSSIKISAVFRSAYCQQDQIRFPLRKSRGGEQKPEKPNERKYHHLRPRS